MQIVHINIPTYSEYSFVNTGSGGVSVETGSLIFCCLGSWESLGRLAAASDEEKLDWWMSDQYGWNFADSSLC